MHRHPIANIAELKANISDADQQRRAAGDAARLLAAISGVALAVGLMGPLPFFMTAGALFLSGTSVIGCYHLLRREASFYRDAEQHRVLLNEKIKDGTHSATSPLSSDDIGSNSVKYRRIVNRASHRHTEQSR